MAVKSNHGRANIFEASQALARQHCWTPDNCDGFAKISHADFLMDMMCYGPSDCIRTIESFWKLYQDMGIAKRINQSKDLIFDLGRLRTLLASRYEEWRI